MTPRRGHRLGLVDLLDQAVGGIGARPLRAVLTVLGTVLGVATLVATLGLSTTVRGQISDRFDALRAVEVRVRPVGGSSADPFPRDVDDRLRRLRGVVAAGVLRPIAPTRFTVTATVGEDPVAVDLFAVSGGALRAVGPPVQGADAFDAGRPTSGDHLAFVGAAAARALHLPRLGTPTSIVISGLPFLVIGTIDSSARAPELLNAVVVPRSVGDQLWPGAGTDHGEVIIETAPGAAQQVGRQAPLAVRPDAPQSMAATAPPDPKELRRAVESDVQALFLLLASVCLLIGAVGIANTTLVSILERTSEIGLRRALGARRRHIAVQFLAESTLLGLLGGVVGTSSGVLFTAAVAATKGWVTVLPIPPVTMAPLLGGCVGLVAGVAPAWRAARTEPVEALRRST